MTSREFKPSEAAIRQLTPPKMLSFRYSQLLKCLQPFLVFSPVYSQCCNKSEQGSPSEFPAMPCTMRAPCLSALGGRSSTTLWGSMGSGFQLWNIACHHILLSSNSSDGKQYSVSGYAISTTMTKHHFRRNYTLPKSGFFFQGL